MIWARRLQWTVASAIFSAGVWTAFVRDLLAGCSAGRLNRFDGALFSLQALYTSRGLTPYRDFGFVYPPGNAWLFGSLLGLDSLASLNAAVAVVVGIAILANVALLWIFVGRSPGLLAASGLLLLISGLAISLWATMTATSLPSQLSITIVLLLALSVRAGPFDRVAVRLSAAVAFFLALCRWDTMAAFLLVELALLAGGAVLALLAPEARSAVMEMVRRIGRAAIAHASGLGLAMLAVLMSGLWAGALDNVIDFMFRVPFTIRPYRDLPLPSFTSLTDRNAWWLLCTGAIVAILVTMIADLFTKTRNGRNVDPALLRAILLASLPLSAEPYALGRSDGVHFIPLVVLTLAALLLIAFDSGLKDGLARYRLVAAVFLLLPALPAGTELFALGLHLEACGHTERELTRSLADCRALVPDDVASIFVGRTQYDRFLLNRVALYHVRLDVKPATAFISDEPGIQNDCLFGERIASNLANAPRPMLTFLDTRPGSTEPNLTRNMKSCGKIEDFLEMAPHRVLGSCAIDRRPIEVRLYE